jgi:hypothetical protein
MLTSCRPQRLKPLRIVLVRGMAEVEGHALPINPRPFTPSALQGWRRFAPLDSRGRLSLHQQNLGGQECPPQIYEQPLVLPQDMHR